MLSGGRVSRQAVEEKQYWKVLSGGKLNGRFSASGCGVGEGVEGAGQGGRFSSGDSAGQGFAFLIRFLVWEGCERNGERKFVPFRICVGKKVFLGGARRGFRFLSSF